MEGAHYTVSYGHGFLRVASEIGAFPAGGMGELAGQSPFQTLASADPTPTRTSVWTQDGP